MTIIGLINQKGGVSKSTTSIHLAYWLSVKKKKKVLLIDADSQKSSSQWIDGMDQQIPVSILQSPDEILEQLPDLSSNYEYVIVDGPASLSEATRAILFRCDVAVIPTQPTGVDLRSASDAMRDSRFPISKSCHSPKASDRRYFWTISNGLGLIGNCRRRVRPRI
jgi:chromosome partitioning protein